MGSASSLGDAGRMDSVEEAIGYCTREVLEYDPRPRLGTATFLWLAFAALLILFEGLRQIVTRVGL